MNSSSTPSFTFPRAQQAQIIRANQRDLYHVSSLKEQAESVLRAWLGTRWLTRWDKEIDFVIKMCYYGITTGRAVQTLGEEYTDIWQFSSWSKRVPPSPSARAIFVLSSLLPPYILGRCGQNVTLNARHPNTARWLRRIPTIVDVATEVNLALFYLNGTYYNLIKRLMGIRHLSSIPQDPHTRPPSYSLLGIMILIKLIHRAIQIYKESWTSSLPGSIKGTSMSQSTSLDILIDNRSAALFLSPNTENDAKPAEEDEGTALNIKAIPEDLRASRNCTLCLEERTDSCVTECGHLFCWNCIMGWGREKAECPLCRQSLSLDKLLPIYNL